MLPLKVALNSCFVYVIKTGELGVVMGNLDLLSTLFRNLLDNAIKFRRNDLEAVVRISSAIKDFPEQSEYAPGQKALAVSINDNGLGVQSSDREKIFDLFYKNHQDKKIRGSGIGLAIARKIMEMHGGYIYMEQKDNEDGAIFTCYFPVGLDSPTS
jgi:signal transduction histidine kinase